MIIEKEFLRNKLLSQNFLEGLRRRLPRLRFETHTPNHMSGDLLRNLFGGT